MELSDIALLPALVALLEEQSVSAAARRQGVTQPAMSRTLQRLRDAIGDELLVKLGRGLRRTIRADALLDPARQALRQATEVTSPSAPCHAPTATSAFTWVHGRPLRPSRP